MNNKFAVSFSLGIQNSMEYRFNFFMGFASLFFPIFIQLFLWKAVYSHASNMNLYGYTYHQMIVYTIVAALISRLVATGLEYDINHDIKSGGSINIWCGRSVIFLIKYVSTLGEGPLVCHYVNHAAGRGAVHGLLLQGANQRIAYTGFWCRAFAGGCA